MKKQFNDPRGGMIIALGVLLTALWLVIAYGAYEESKREKYEVRVKPGAVTYGTLSTASVPTVSVPARRSTMPMISGGSVRAYAHSGHASMPKASGASNYRLHTTSSATVHSIGGGGSTGGGGAYGGGGASSSSKGINYSSGSVSMPTLAMATSSRSSSDVSGLTSGIASAASSFSQSAMTTTETSPASSPARRGGIRRGTPTDEGTDGEWKNGGAGDGDWWYWDDWAGEWIKPWDGALRIGEGGVTYKYEGGEWVPVGDQGDPTNPTPLGDTPWHWMLLLLAVYAIVKRYVKKQNAI
jgi:hypothetical protein